MTEGNDSSSLLMVFTICRHGDRGPLVLLPNDKNQDFWENQLGLLTKQGKQNAFELGLWYRKHYDGLLPTEYNTNDVYAYSTDSDRTLTTAQCVLAAMYPPPATNRWHQTLDWQPIPVHITHNQCESPEAMLRALDIETFPIERCVTTGQIEKFNRILQNKPMWEEWNRYYYGDEKMKLIKVIVSNDAVVTGMKQGLQYELPLKFDFKKFCESIVDAIELSAAVLPLAQQIGESVLNAINKLINARISGENQYKMCIYSTHDFTLLSVLEFLNIQMPRPQYCGSLTFELHKLADGEHYIKIQNRLKYDSDLMDVSIVEGEKFCPLQYFQNIVGKHSAEFN